jgi:hypothetical protein
MSRILCAWSPRWAIANWRRRNPSTDAQPDAPLALIETVRQVRRLTAVSPEAAALGLFAGQKATDAKALVPELVTVDAEPERDAEALTALVDWCVRFSPAGGGRRAGRALPRHHRRLPPLGREGEMLADFRAGRSPTGCRSASRSPTRRRRLGAGALRPRRDHRPPGDRRTS